MSRNPVSRNPVSRNPVSHLLMRVLAVSRKGRRGVGLVALAMLLFVSSAPVLGVRRVAAPQIGVDVPYVDGTAINFAGTATGDELIVSVVLLIRHEESGDYWNGQGWVSAEQVILDAADQAQPSALLEAGLDAYLTRSSTWTFRLNQDRLGTFKAIHWAVDQLSTRSARVESLAVIEQAVREEPPADEPEPDPVIPDPVMPDPVMPDPVMPDPVMPPPIADQPEESPTPVSNRLLESADLVYEGSFGVPTGAAGRESSLAYAGAGLAYNPRNDSLFITGHDWHQRTAEISVASLQIGADSSNLERSTFVQAPTDALDGKLPDIAVPAENDYAKVGGYLVNDSDLIISGYHYYDAAGTQVRSHLLTDIGLGDSSEMVSLSDEVDARWLGGPMAHIPTPWRAAFGGDLFLGGLAGIPIAGNSSVGPAAATFSRASLTGHDPAQLVLGYPLASALDVPEAQSELWNLTSTVKGIVFPEQAASVLFFGTQGVGEYCYGTGPDCNDPVNEHQGTHAYPYRYQVWAYDAADMSAVFRAERTPESLRPYGVWELELPYSPATKEITGVAYDAAGNRIFVSQAFGDGDYPVIHVFSVGP